MMLVNNHVVSSFCIILSPSFSPSTQQSCELSSILVIIILFYECGAMISRHLPNRTICPKNVVLQRLCLSYASLDFSLHANCQCLCSSLCSMSVDEAMMVLSAICLRALWYHRTCCTRYQLICKCNNK